MDALFKLIREAVEKRFTGVITIKFKRGQITRLRTVPFNETVIEGKNFEDQPVDAPLVREAYAAKGRKMDMAKVERERKSVRHPALKAADKIFGGK